MEPKAVLLAIDDDAALSKGLESYFCQMGYQVHLACSGGEGLAKLDKIQPDLVLLDVVMPQMTGWEVCKRIRDTSSVPIIMLTARADEQDRVMGLKLGADDYVVKPFSLRELDARIEAVLRRAQREAPRTPRKTLYATSDLTIDSERLEVTRDGEHVEMTARELHLLIYLAENAGQIVTHQQILRQVWGPEYVDHTDYVKLFVWRLRNKIEPDPAAPRYILTERGLGYRMAPAH